jgi:hypothetical protein
MLLAYVNFAHKAGVGAREESFGLRAKPALNFCNWFIIAGNNGTKTIIVCLMRQQFPVNYFFPMAER